MNEFNEIETKKEINNFLWCWLPPTTTLQDAEMIASMLYQKFMEEWEKHQNRQEGPAE
jgi:hypothetical protein